MWSKLLIIDLIILFLESCSNTIIMGLYYVNRKLSENDVLQNNDYIYKLLINITLTLLLSCFQDLMMKNMLYYLV